MVNLFDNIPLNKTLEKIIYHGDAHAGTDWVITSENLKDKKFIDDNRDRLNQAMIYKWFKMRFLKSLSDMNVQDAIMSGWLQPLESDRGTDWIRRVMDQGQVVYDFIPNVFEQIMADKITGIRDYFYSACTAYIEKELGKQKPFINLSFLTTVKEYDTFDNVKKISDRWHAEQETKHVELEKMNAGTSVFMTLSDGFVIRQLNTAQALDAESDVMGHCVGAGGYDAGVKKGKIQIYSLRDKNGVPHATFEVKDKKIMQCKGKANTTPVKKYIPYIQEFVTRTKFEPQGDYINMGLVQDKKGKFWNIYKLPRNLEIDTLPLSRSVGIDIPNGLKCNVLDLNNATDYTLPENLTAKYLLLNGTTLKKLPAGVHCKSLALGGVRGFTIPANSGIEEFGLYCTDGIKLPRELKCKTLNLAHAKNFTLPKKLVVDDLDLTDTDDVVLPSEFKCKKLELGRARNFTLPKILTVEQLDLSDADITQLPEIRGCKYLALIGNKNIEIPKNLTVTDLNLNYADGIKIPNGFTCTRLMLNNATNFVLPYKLNVAVLDLNNTKNAKIPTGKYKKINLEDATGFQWPQQLTADEILISMNENVSLPAGVNCKKLSVVWGGKFTARKNMVVDELILHKMKGVNIQPGLRCKHMEIIDSENIELPENLTLDRLDLIGIDGVKIPSTLSCRELNLKGSTNIEIPAGIKCGTIIMPDGTQKKNFKMAMKQGIKKIQNKTLLGQIFGRRASKAD